MIANNSTDALHLNNRKSFLRHDNNDDGDGDTTTSRSSKTIEQKGGVDVLVKYDTSSKDYVTGYSVCSDPDIDIYFINGINVLPEGNAAGVTALYGKLADYLRSSFDLTVQFYGIYNPTDGMVVDLLECVDLVAQQSYKIGPGMVIIFSPILLVSLIKTLLFLFFLLNIFLIIGCSILI